MIIGILVMIYYLIYIYWEIKRCDFNKDVWKMIFYWIDYCFDMNYEGFCDSIKFINMYVIKYDVFRYCI